jgi:hypothetical protein
MKTLLFCSLVRGLFTTVLAQVRTLPALTFLPNIDACEDGFHNSAGTIVSCGARINKDLALCDRQLGLSAQIAMHHSSYTPLLETTCDMSSLLGLYLDNAVGPGISFELWIKLPADFNGYVAGSSDLVPLLSIGHGQPDGGDYGAGADFCTREENDFQLALRGLTLYVSYRTAPNGTIADSCPFYSPASSFRLVPGAISHIVVALAGSKQTIYVNGDNVLDINHNFQSDLQHWNPNYLIQYFRDHLGRNAQYAGSTLYKLAVHTSTLSGEMARNLFVSGLPSVQPSGVNLKVVINEDGELEAGSHQPDWYERERTVDDGDHIPTIRLEAHWLDQEIHDLLRSANATNGRDDPREYFFVKKLPAQGRLFQMDGTPIESSLTPVLYNASVAYLPPKDSHSSSEGVEFTIFEYCVSGSAELSTTDCVDYGSVSLEVVSVSDPPIPEASEILLVVREGERLSWQRVQFGPYNLAPPAAFEETSFRSITLTGSDPADSDRVVSVKVTEHPMQGYLALSPDVEGECRFIEDCTMTTLRSLNWTTESPAYMDYYAYGLTHPDSLTDSFCFQVADELETWSKEACVDVQILSSLVAVNSSRWAALSVDEARMKTPLVVVENITAYFPLRGLDTSKLNRQIHYQVTKTPPAFAGRLIDPVDGSSVEEGMILSAGETYPYSRGVEVGLVPAPNFQNYPCQPREPTVSACNHQGLDFEYRVVVLNEAGIVVSASDPQRQEFVVQNFNSPPSVAGPTDVLQVERAPETKVYLPRECIEELEKSYSPKDCPHMLTLDGIEVTDPDHDIDLVLVNVEVNHGIFCVDHTKQHLLHKLDSWCDRRVLFLAFPNEIGEIFENSTYRSPALVERDEIRISVLDGSDCLDHFENEYTNGRENRGFQGIRQGSFHPTCYNETIVLHLSVISSTSHWFQVDNAMSFAGYLFGLPSNWELVVDLLVWIVSLYSVCRRKHDNIEHHDDEDEVEKTHPSNLC